MKVFKRSRTVAVELLACLVSALGFGITLLLGESLLAYGALSLAAFFAYVLIRYLATPYIEIDGTEVRFYNRFFPFRESVDVSRVDFGQEGRGNQLHLSMKSGDQKTLDLTDVSEDGRVRLYMKLESMGVIVSRGSNLGGSLSDQV